MKVSWKNLICRTLPWKSGSLPIRQLWEASPHHHPQTETYDLRARNRASKSTLRSGRGSQKYFNQLLML